MPDVPQESGVLRVLRVVPLTMSFACDRCGSKAVFVCTVCRAPFCTVRGCPQGDSHHPCLPYPEAIPDDGAPLHDT